MFSKIYLLTVFKITRGFVAVTCSYTNFSFSAETSKRDTSLDFLFTFKCSIYAMKLQKIGFIYTFKVCELLNILSTDYVRCRNVPIICHQPVKATAQNRLL